jgi:alpha-L-rhamnosidase
VLPVWIHPGIPETPEIALFRRSFDLDLPVNQASLQIFADTRYEVWLDGAWIGRGPARFSSTLREYDIYSLGDLPAGNHLIAVQVQWAPNNRRAESLAPELAALVQGADSCGNRLITTTSTQWQGMLSDAWDRGAAPVDTRGLIGPTEVLDLRRLPPDWNQPNFSGAGWHPVVMQTALWQTGSFERRQASALENGPPAAVYQPRSIALPANVPVPVTLQASGLLSPGFIIGEVLGESRHSPSSDIVYTLAITATGQQPTAAARPGSTLRQDQASEFTPLLLETIASAAPSLDWAYIDGKQIEWQPAGKQRPDVYLAAEPITPGLHTVTFDPKETQFPGHAPLLAISQQGLSIHGLGPSATTHGGQRMLLADLQTFPVSALSTGAEPTASQSPIPALHAPISTLEFKTLPAYAVLDLGRTVHGRLVAEVEGPPGAMIDIGWDERLWGESRRPLPYPGSMYPEWDQVDTWVLDGGLRTITTIDARAGRYVLIAAWGEGEIALRKIRVYEERYPLEAQGEFHSSDALLDRIWQVGVDTLRPNLTDAYTDTPWRERSQWWGDAYVEHKIGRLVFDDLPLLRRGLIYMADAMQTEPFPGKVPNNDGLHMLDYTMLWVHSLADYVEQSEDRALAVRLYPEVRQFIAHMGRYENPESGLLELQQGPWSTTAYIDMLGYYSRYGQSSALNALYAATLHRAAQIAQWAGDDAAAQDWNLKEQNVERSLNRLLYLPAEQRYLTHLDQGAAFSPTLHAQAWPLAYDLVPQSEIKGVISALLEMLSPGPAGSDSQARPVIGTYGMFWVLEALGKAGEISPAIDLVRQNYGDMLDAGSTTWWEAFDADRYPQSSFSHGWSGAPTYFLSTYVLGVQPLDGNTWQVRPAFDGVDFASGAIPLHSGRLQVSWEHTRCGELQLEVTAPPDTRGEAIIPHIASDLKLILNGKAVQPAMKGVRYAPDGVHLALGAGEHRIAGYYPCQP